MHAIPSSIQPNQQPKLLDSPRWMSRAPANFDRRCCFDAADRSYESFYTIPRGQVRIALRTKHYALSTEKAYVDWIHQFVLFNSPREIQVAHLLFYNPSNIVTKAKKRTGIALSHGVNKRHPREMGAAEIERFLNHLAVNCNIASSTQNQALCALVFLYEYVLKKEVGDLTFLWSKKPRKLPVVFTREEVRAVLQQLKGTKWLMANLLYGAGLRLTECLRLRVHPVR